MEKDLGVAARDPGFSSQVSKLVTQTDVRIPAGGSLHEQDSQDSTSKSDPSIMFPCGHVRARLRAPLGISSHFPLLLPSLPTGARVADGAPGGKLWREVKGTGKVSGTPGWCHLENHSIAQRAPRRVVLRPGELARSACPVNREC